MWSNSSNSNKHESTFTKTLKRIIIYTNTYILKQNGVWHNKYKLSKLEVDAKLIFKKIYTKNGLDLTLTQTFNIEIKKINKNACHKLAYKN